MKVFRKSLLVATFFCFLTACDFTLNNLKFDSEKWKTSDIRTRGRMFNDLKNNKILEGKSKSEVKELLGSPISNNSDYWVYKIDLGYRFGSTVWTYNLNVEFDTQTQTARKVYETD